MLERVWRKGTLLHCWWECKLVQPLWKTVWRFLKKLKLELLHDPAIPLLSIYPVKMKTLMWKDTCTPVFIAPVYDSQDMEMTHVPINRRLLYEIQICEWNYPRRESLERSLQKSSRGWNMDRNSSYSHQPDRQDAVKYGVLDKILKRISPL